MPKHSVKIKNPLTVDLTRLVPKLLKLYNCKRHILVGKLNEMWIEGSRFKFVYDEDTFFRIYVKCPSCHEKKLKLYFIEKEWGCGDCHVLARPARKTRRSTLEAHLIRPLKILYELEKKLVEPNITMRQRQLINKKIGRIQKAIPSHIFDRRTSFYDALIEAGVIPK